MHKPSTNTMTYTNNKKEKMIALCATFKMSILEGGGYFGEHRKKKRKNYSVTSRVLFFFIFKVGFSFFGLFWLVSSVL